MKKCLVCKNQIAAQEAHRNVEKGALHLGPCAEEYDRIKSNLNESEGESELQSMQMLVD